MKPDEQHLWLFYLKLGADAILVRSTGILYHFNSLGGQGALVEAADNHTIPALQGDSSLNAANIVSADVLLSSGLETLAPAHDCNSDQIVNLLKGLGERKKQMEIIVHTNLPVFHTEYCIFARFLSTGNSYLDCGRPCERHTIHVRDPDGIDHLVEADMGCRNTVFEGKAQTALQYLPEILSAGGQFFRIELVDQSPELVPGILEGYRRALTSGSYKYYKRFSEWLQTVPDANGRAQGFSSGSLEPRQERDKSSMKPTASSSIKRSTRAS
jgi:collagenase-like PrtC family protease